ncbi:MAG: hypothetical protein HW407_2127 [Bacteroidetes bacterium]|nr:hypothetical protein [Bacteroidota bacterium]
MAHAMRVESLGIKTGHMDLGVFQALLQDIPDSKSSKRCGPAILEDPNFRPKVNLEFQTVAA